MSDVKLITPKLVMMEIPKDFIGAVIGPELEGTISNYKKILISNNH